MYIGGGLSLLIVIIYSLTRPVYYTIDGVIFGTTYTVIYKSDHQNKLNTAQIKEGIETTLNQIDLIASTWHKESAISRFNLSNATEWFEVSDELVEIINLSLEIYQQTEGAFDIT